MQARHWQLFFDSSLKIHAEGSPEGGAFVDVLGAGVEVVIFDAGHDFCIVAAEVVVEAEVGAVMAVAASI